MSAQRFGPVWKGALVTGVAVAAGFGVAMTTLPPLETPQHVALAFADAVYGEDWPAAWDLMCTSTSDAFGYSSFVDALTTAREVEGVPSDVDIEVGDVRVERGPAAPYVMVRVNATSAEDGQEEWESSDRFPMIEEEGELRVCFQAVVAEP